MGAVSSSLAQHSVVEEAFSAIFNAQTRADLTEALHSLLSDVVDLKRRVTVVEHPGATQALVDLAVQVDGLNKQLAIAQAELEKSKTPANAAQVTLLEQEITNAKAQAQAALSTKDGASDVVAVLRDLLSSVSTPAPTQE